MADRRRAKKKLLFVSMLVGVACSIGLFFVPQGDWSSAAILYGIGLFMASASVVFNDSLLVSVCEEKQYDFVSSLGYSFGYLGGGILFAVNVLMYLKPELFGISDPVMAVKISFLTVGVWWFLFTLPMMFYVDEPETEKGDDNLWVLTLSTVKELKHLFKDIFQNKNLFYFILGYWFYIDGVYTVMTMAVDFGLSLGFESKDLITALLITQFIGFPSAIIFGKLAGKFSGKSLITLGLCIYLFTIVAASQMTEAWHFYGLACIIGISQGGVQALSRSMYAQLIPKEKSGEYFGFFNMLGKFASVLGPLLVALVAKFSSEPRHTILSLSILIVLGWVFLAKVQISKSVN